MSTEIEPEVSGRALHERAPGKGTDLLRGAALAAVYVVKFLRFFPGGFRDETYLDWERNYKWEAHERWSETLAPPMFCSLLRKGAYAEVARRTLKIESRTNLLFSFEKMAVHDAVKPPSGARDFAVGLDRLLHGAGELAHRFDA